EPELEKRGSRYGIGAILLYLAKPERAVQRLRRSHRRQRVEEHSAIAAPPRLGDHGFGEPSTEPAPSRVGPNKQPLHLARLLVDPPQRDAAVIGEEDELVEAERVDELGLEVLERKVDSEAVRVLAEEIPHRLQIFGSRRPHDSTLAQRSRTAQVETFAGSACAGERGPNIRQRCFWPASSTPVPALSTRRSPCLPRTRTRGRWPAGRP